MATTVYLDHASTTPVDAAVIEEMRAALALVGNPSSTHVDGVWAARALELARARVAALLAADPDEVVFTSGGTEANNLALIGACSRGGAPSHLITSAVEHPSVLTACDWLESLGMRVTRLPVDREGFVDPDAVRRALGPDTRLVSIGQANHEVGTIQPVDEIARVCREAGVPFHTDACQSFGRFPVPAGALATVNAHKIYGPKGVGALRVPPGARLAPLLFGGGQERGLRAGTPNLPGIVGFGRAAERIAEEDVNRIRRLRDLLVARVLGGVSGSWLNGSRERRLPGNASLGFEGVSAWDLVRELDRAGIRVSRGSACSSGSTAPSPVLIALGLPAERALGVIRVSLGHGTTQEEIDRAAGAIETAVRKLRQA